MSRLQLRSLALAVTTAIAAATFVGTAAAVPAAAADVVPGSSMRPVSSDGPWSHPAPEDGATGTQTPPTSGGPAAPDRRSAAADLATATTRSVSGVVHLPAGAPTDWYRGVYVYAFDQNGFQAVASPDSTGGTRSTDSLRGGTRCA